MNFKEETLKVIKSVNRELSDIDYVTDGKAFTEDIEVFLEDCDFDYDNGYGGQEINCLLAIVFKDGTWLERSEYDGSEWWDYKRTPEKGHLERKHINLKED